MASTLNVGTLARSAPATLAAVRDPSSVSVTFRSAFTPPWTIHPFAAAPPAPPPAQGGPSGLLSRAVLGTVRPAFDVRAGNELVSVEPGGNPDDLPLGKLTVALTALGIGFSVYGMWSFYRNYLRG